MTQEQESAIRDRYGLHPPAQQRPRPSIRRYSREWYFKAAWSAVLTARTWIRDRPGDHKLAAIWLDRAACCRAEARRAIRAADMPPPQHALIELMENTLRQGRRITINGATFGGEK